MLARILICFLKLFEHLGFMCFGHKKTNWGKAWLTDFVASRYDGASPALQSLVTWARMDGMTGQRINHFQCLGKSYIAHQKR